MRLIHRLCEGLFGRYFAYRTKYVAYFRENAPERVGWAVASEIARLVFTLACTILIALILWALVLGAWQSGGHLLALAAFAVGEAENADLVASGGVEGNCSAGAPDEIGCVGADYQD